VRPHETDTMHETVHTLSSAQPALFQALSAHLSPGGTLAEYVISLDLTARKPS
jgi:hypothetical protein